MNRRIILSVGGTTAGLLTTAFLPATVAFADTGSGTAGDVGSAALGSLLGGSSPLGATGSLTPDVSTPSPAPLGDTAGTPSLGDTGSLTPLGSLTPDTGSTPNAGLTPTATTPDTGLTPDATPGDTAPTDSDSFTIGDDTFAPIQADGSEGFTPISPLFGAAPFFQVGSGEQSFDVTSGTGPDATDLGNVTTSEDVTNLFGGIHNTEFTITDVDPASGATEADLPTVGTVYDVTNFGNGFANIYTAIPGADGSDSTITDTLTTPFGDFNIPTDFDATGMLDPGDTFSALSALGSDTAGTAADAAGGATDAAGTAADAAGGATDAAGTAADAAGGAADAAGGVGDAIGSVDPLDFLGF